MQSVSEMVAHSRYRDDLEFWCESSGVGDLTSADLRGKVPNREGGMKP